LEKKTKRNLSNKLANCHIKIAPTATSKLRQLPYQNCANCHIKIAPTATLKTIILLIINIKYNFLKIIKI